MISGVRPKSPIVRRGSPAKKLVAHLPLPKALGEQVK